MGRSGPVSVEVGLHWDDGRVGHRDGYRFSRLDLSNDLLPAELGARLRSAPPGETVWAELDESQLAGPRRPELVLELALRQFHRDLGAYRLPPPRVGRYFPRAALAGIAGIHPGESAPARVLARSEDGLTVDLNHPLAGRNARLSARVTSATGAGRPTGEERIDAVGRAAGRGPGMQAPVPGVATDFYADQPFRRADETEDRLFYAVPRLVNHIDDAAIERVRSWYGRLLPREGRILDLMSSWVSHLPDDGREWRVTGLGMNAEELARNPQLADWQVQDLNRDPTLPQPDAGFDAAVCTVSLEYLVRPDEVLREVARVLRPGAPFVLVLSERCFAPKAIALWAELHPFERIALVLDYLGRSGAFERLHSESIRGLSRPADDPYAQVMAHADPVYAVWGYRRGD